MAVACLASSLLSDLLEWRNPDGREEQWGIRYGTDTDFGRVVATEIALPILATVAVIETVVYGLFAVASLAIYPVAGQPHRFFVKLLESSSFTVLWATFDIIASPLSRNLLTGEASARYFANFHIIPVPFFRPEDAGVLDIVHPPESVTPTVAEGAALCIDYVLRGADAKTMNAFRQVDERCYPFMLARAIFAFAYGPRRDERVPFFFGHATRRFILTCRAFGPDDIVIGQLEEIVRNPKTFDEDLPLDETLRGVLNDLKGAAFGEMSSGGLLINDCWLEANRLLANRLLAPPPLQ